MSRESSKREQKFSQSACLVELIWSRCKARRYFLHIHTRRWKIKKCQPMRGLQFNPYRSSGIDLSFLLFPAERENHAPACARYDVCGLSLRKNVRAFVVIWLFSVEADQKSIPRELRDRRDETVEEGTAKEIDALPPPFHPSREGTSRYQSSRLISSTLPSPSSPCPLRPRGGTGTDFSPGPFYAPLAC